MKLYIVEVTLEDGTQYGCQIGRLSDTIQAVIIYPDMAKAWKGVQTIKITLNERYQPEKESPRDRPTYP